MKINIMKKGLFTLIFLFTSFVIGLSQSIPSYWMNVYDLNDLYLLKTNDVEQVIANVTGYYASGGTYNEKWIYNFVDSNKIVGQFFKDSELNSSFEYTFDDSGKLMKKVISSKQPLVGWQSKVTQFEYEGDKLVLEKNLSKDSKLIDYVRFDYNTSNYPIKMTLFDKSTQIISYETADYDVLKKIYVYKVFDGNKKLISEETEYFNFDTSVDKYNDNGDLILLQWPRSNPEKDIFHSLEYKYDENGNWISRKWLILEGKKKKKRSVITRKIIYSRTN